LLERGLNVRAVQLLLRHESWETTMVYRHVVRHGAAGIASPLDLLADTTLDAVRAALEATQTLADPLDRLALRETTELLP
jgi:hypothetical protein